MEDMVHEHPPVHRRRVLVADSDPNVREALRLLLARHPDFTCVGESHDLVELCRDAAALQPDLVLLDWDLRGLGANRLSDLRSACPNASVVVLSTHDEVRARALRDGAAAFVCKGDSPAHLLNTLRAAAALLPVDQPPTANSRWVRVAGRQHQHPEPR